MNKILCSLEEWDSIIDYYRPNASSKTWYLNELKNIHWPLMWGRWNIFKESGEMFNRDNFIDLVTPRAFNSIMEFLPIEKIGENPHLYIINVFTLNFFIDNKDIGFKCISEKYLNDVRNGKSKIVILLLYEGFSGMKGNFDLETIESWRINSKLPSKSVYYITGNLIGDKIAKNKNLDIEVLPVHMFETWNWNNDIKYDKPPVDFNPIDEKYLFLSYNRQPRQYRIYFISELIKNKIFDKGLVSLNRPWDNLIPPYIDKTIQNFIIQNSPFIINPNLNLNFNLACNLEPNDYEKTFISVTTETLIDEDTLFLSEKIWKPIIMGHPFLVYGNKGTLEYLKNIGYKTFDKWIDESYDNEVNHLIRGKMIVNEIKKLSELSLDKLKEIRNEMFEICEFNQKHFIKLITENWKTHNNIILENYLYKIWNEINNENNTYIHTN